MQPDIIAKAQVVGFKEGLTVLSLIGRTQGLTREVVIPRAVTHLYLKLANTWRVKFLMRQVNKLVR